MRAEANCGHVHDVLCSADKLRPLVLDTLNAAISAFKGARGDHQGEFKLTVLTHWGDGKPHVAAHVAAMPARPLPPIIVQVPYLLVCFVVLCLQTSVLDILRCNCDLSSALHGYCRFCLLVGRITWLATDHALLDHVVQIRGHPRVNAAAKDSEWVRQRQVFEAVMPADVNEIVLADHRAVFHIHQWLSWTCQTLHPSSHIWLLFQALQSAWC
jgi:hypothetical protein